ncbi:MAG: hypothetical protein AAGJ11_06180, partial [Bacteroidota bacterium]
PPDVVGTWELTAAENVPYDDDLVFARMTFTADAVRSTFVFLDPDDGELIGRIHDDDYLVSGGQLIVRDAASTTVLDVQRDRDELAVRDLETGVRFRLRAVDPAMLLDPDVLGTWQGERGGRLLTLRFRPDGIVEVIQGDDPEPDTETYTVAGPYLLLGNDPARYTFTRDAEGTRRLVVDADGEETTFSPVDL